MKAVIDRFEGDYAIVLLGDEEVQVDIPIRRLPEGAREGGWLTVSFELDVEGMQRQKEKVIYLLDKLKKKRR